MQIERVIYHIKPFSDERILIIPKFGIYVYISFLESLLIWLKSFGLPSKYNKKYTIIL